MMLKIKRLFISGLLYFFAILDLIHKNLGRLKARNIMFINNQCSISGNVPRDLFLSLFVNKTSKAPDVEVIATGHGVFHYAKEGFHRCGNISFVNTCLFCDFVYNVGFRHCTIFLVESEIEKNWDRKFICRIQN